MSIYFFFLKYLDTNFAANIRENNTFALIQKRLTMYTIYHNTRCSKSRAGLAYVKSKTDKVEVVEYLKEPFTENNFKKLLMKLNKKPIDMVRTQEAIYKSDYKGKNFTDDEWVKIMIENPKLINRPIVVKGNKAVWGVPVEEIDVLF
jgi:arsenate reductase